MGHHRRQPTRVLTPVYVWKRGHAPRVNPVPARRARNVDTLAGYSGVTPPVALASRDTDLRSTHTLASHLKEPAGHGDEN